MLDKNDILYGITTYGSAPYVDLGLSYFKKFGCDVIVIDDGSRDNKLREVCNKHETLLINDSVKNSGHRPGDLIGFITLIEQAKHCGYKYCVKVSRRWVCKEDPTPSLIDLINRSGGYTFSNKTTTYNFGFRTEFTGMDVDAWCKRIPDIINILKSNNDPFVEAELHNVAKRTQPDSEQYRHYVAGCNYEGNAQGYVHWDWMGTDRKNTPNHILWHDCNGRLDYTRAAQELGLNYRESDF